MFMCEADVYDSENDDDLCYYSGAFALGGDTDEDFAKSYWMIDGGCTDHLHCLKMTLHTWEQLSTLPLSQMDRQYRCMVLARSYFNKGSEPIVLNEVWYAPHIVHRLLSVNTLSGQGYRCVINNQESRIWNTSGTLVIQAAASSPRNNLHWFQS